MRIDFIADVFAEDVTGGGELNNEEFINICTSLGHEVRKINSHLVHVPYIKNNLNSRFVIANFINLRKDCKDFLTEHAEYVIYEHDHKYLKNRNPATFHDFLAPKDMIVNFKFYQKARAILCQSGFHAGILEKNLGLINNINLSGSLWSLNSIEKMRELSKEKKSDKCSVMNSNTPHKNTNGAVKYCQVKGFEYELIHASEYFDFLQKLSKNRKLIFFPKTPETLCRLVVEARMMNVDITTNKLIGAAQEPWFSLKGEELIEEVLEMRKRIPEKALECFDVQ